MEKRSLARNRTALSVACGHVSIHAGGTMHEGTMLNCSAGGTYIELDKRLDKGTIVMVKSSGVEDDQSPTALPEGFRTVSLAEVKWSRPIEDDPLARFGLGLKYLNY